MCDFDVLSLLDRVHAAEREFYRLYFRHDGSQEGQEDLELARLEKWRLEDELYRAVQAGRAGKVTLF